jgi:hypothetical protein
MRRSLVLVSAACTACAISLPAMATPFPFKPEPAAFAAYLNASGKPAEDGTRVIFSNLGTCSTGTAGSQKVYQCKEGNVTISSPSGSKVCTLSSGKSEGLVSYETAQNGRGQWKITTNGCKDQPSSTP